MQRTHLLALGLAIGLVACASQQAPSNGGTQAALAAQSDYKKAIEAEDVEAIKALMSSPSDSTYYYFTGGTGGHGSDGFRPWFAECDSIRLTYSNLIARLSPAGDAAVVTYLENGRAICGGKAGSWTSTRATVVWEWLNGKWRMVHGHWSVPVAEEPVKK